MTMVLRGITTFWEQHFNRASSIGANKESQKLFPFVKMAEKKTARLFKTNDVIS